MVIEIFYKPNTFYTFNLSPNDKYQYFGDPKRFTKFYSFIYELLLGLNGQYTMNIELSEPRGPQNSGKTGPRLHTHGILYFETKKALIKFMMNDYYKLLRVCRVEIDSISDFKYWYDYCHKQLFFNKCFKNTIGLWKRGDLGVALPSGKDI